MAQVPAMLNRAFRHRSGRVICLSRLVLAASFLFAVWIDPAQPARYQAETYAMLTAYAVLAAAQLVLTWNNWWFDFRFARPSHLLDVAVFILTVFYTEAYSGTFTTPFFTFFVFLLFAAMMRWGWRGALQTAAIALVAFVVLGLIALASAPETFAGHRFSRRIAYLTMLPILMVWFGVNQQTGSSHDVSRPRELDVGPGAQAPPIEAMLRHARDRTGAGRIVFAWWDKEEPWVNVAELEDERIATHRFGPSELGEPLVEPRDDRAFLFDRRRGRALSESEPGSRRYASVAPGIDPALADRFAIDRGLAVRVRAADYEGEMFLLDAPGLCCDDLAVGAALGEEISVALDRYTIIRRTEEAALGRARASLARDLHDSVIQSILGTSLRLEALREVIRRNEDPEPEIDSIQADLAAEHRSTRKYIIGLRGARGADRQIDLTASIADLADRLSRQWNISCRLGGGDAHVEAPVWIEHELHQIVREAVGNAVRHGHAGEVTLTLARADGTLGVIVEDDGCGFPVEGELDSAEIRARRIGPHSLIERLHSLGGDLALCSSRAGARLVLRLPIETPA